MTRTARGQTLVLFALTLLFVVVMVCVTLSLGFRTKQKMELQALADAGAYSNAVAVARTYNSVAVANRATIATLVAGAGAQSLISWSSMFQGVAGATWDAMEEIAGRNEACRDLLREGGRIQEVAHGEVTVFERWDKFAAAEVRKLALHQALFEVDPHSKSRGATNPRLLLKLPSLLTGRVEDLRTERLVDALIRRSGVKGQVIASHAVDDINGREVDPYGLMGFGQLPEGYNEEKLRWHQLEVVMGSRGHPFIPGRMLKDGRPASVLMEERVRIMLENIHLDDVMKVRVWNARGSGYFNDNLQPTHGRAPDPAQMGKDDVGHRVVNFHDWGADDHANITVEIDAPGCIEKADSIFDPDRPSTDDNGGAWSFVHTTLGREGDNHQWSDGRDGVLREANHTLHYDQDHDTWPNMYDYPYWKLGAPQDLFGQPRLYALFERDVSTRMPWDLRFDVDFGGGGAAVRLGPPARMSATAAGLAYYHRGGDWKEPPNLLNPFWRATLAPIDVDLADSTVDVPELLRAADPSAWPLFDGLRRAGFKGVH